MIKAVIFDLDGTLMDTLTDLHVAVNRTLDYFAYPRVDREKTRLSVGNGVNKLVQRCLPEQLGHDFSEIMARFNAIYAQCSSDNTKPFDGVIGVLQKLREKAIKVAVVSNKTEKVVEQLCKEHFFGLVDVAIGDNGVRPLKPHPQPIEAALSFLGVDSSQTVYVGDQEVDVMTAKNANLRLIAAGWGFRTAEELTAAGAQTVCDHPEQILDLVV